MNTDCEFPFEDCIGISGEERWQGESIQWSRQAVVALSLHLIAWPELDVPHWFGEQAKHNLKVTPDGYDC